MLKKILLVLAALVVVFLIVVAFQPADFKVTRSTLISAPASAVFAQVNDFHRWEAWSPWAKMDPNMKTTYAGAPAGTGSIYSWVGNSQVGAGRMTIIESRPHELVRINFEFLKPFAVTNLADFTFKPQGGQTLVTWEMSGKKNFVSKSICMFMNMDKMVGGDFEKGLAKMKSLAEGTGK